MIARAVMDEVKNYVISKVVFCGYDECQSIQSQRYWYIFFQTKCGKNKPITGAGLGYM